MSTLMWKYDEDYEESLIAEAGNGGLYCIDIGDDIKATYKGDPGTWTYNTITDLGDYRSIWAARAACERHLIEQSRNDQLIDQLAQAAHARRYRQMGA
jgi:hypothetical protein